MKVYCVFECWGEGDSYTVFDLKGVAKDLNAAHQKVAELLHQHLSVHAVNVPENIEDNRIHKSMSATNNWSYVGKREDCKDMCNWTELGGWVIEETDLIEES